MTDKKPELSAAMKSKVEPKIFKKNPIIGTKFTIAISSAKGGVGKSTFATNLALALKQIGCKVGLLDADIYGPSIPKMLGIDEKPKNNQEEDMVMQIPDKSEPYNMHLLNAYLDSLLKKNLNEKEYNVLVMSYGLNCDKHSAKEIAAKLGIEGSSAYVRVSQLKKQAVEKLIENVDHSQVLDYL